MSTSLLSFLNPRHRRFWLFAPFFGLAALTLIYFAIWQFIGGQIRDGLIENGVAWEHQSTAGFPARLSLEIDKMTWQGDGVSWANDKVSMTVMPFNDDHAILDFIGPHQLTYSGQPMRLAHQGHMVSFVGDLDGLLRMSMDAKQPQLSAKIKNRQITLDAETIDVQMRRQGDDTARYDAALTSSNLIVNSDTKIGRLNPLVKFDLKLLTEADPDALIGQRISIEKLNLQRDKLTLAGRGRLRLGASGFFNGSLDLNFVNLEALVDTLEEFGLSDRRDRKKLLFIAGLSTAFKGGTQDRINLDLEFRKGKAYLGNIKLGAAPRWRP